MGCWHINGKKEMPTQVNCVLEVGSVNIHSYLIVSACVPMDSDRWISWGQRHTGQAMQDQDSLVHCPTAINTVGIYEWMMSQSKLYLRKGSQW